MNQRLKIVFGADYYYAKQVETTLKSICCHNRDVDFYLLNRDFPSEWFETISAHLALLGSTISNIYVSNETIADFDTYPHINSEATYFRYFIPELIDEDKVLYLDCDLVVNGSLNDFFRLDLGNAFVAAVKDPIAVEYHQQENEFNAGVLLINNALWRQEKICQKALDYTERNKQLIRNGDQEVLNVLFRGRWLSCSRNFNYQTGIEFMWHKAGKSPLMVDDFSRQLPLVAHYSTAAKPWKPGDFQSSLHGLYVFYNTLAWTDIVEDKVDTEKISDCLVKTDKQPDNKKKHTATVAVITSSTGRAELERAILSVRAQTYPAKHYVIVDGEQFAEKVRAIVKKYPEVVTVYLPMNTGANGKVNSTINAIAPFLTQEDYVCYLDDDNWYEPEHVESLVETMEKGGADYAYALRNFCGENGNLICPDNWESVGNYDSLPEDVYFDIQAAGSQQKLKMKFNRITARHIDTNCYFFPRMLALSLAVTWETGGRLNDKAVFKRLCECGGNGVSSGRFTVNYTFDFFKAYGNTVEQWRSFGWTDSAIKQFGDKMLEILGEYALKCHDNQPPWLTSK
ncbi:glycosyltransferase [Neisseria sp. ZJ106]|uniref:Glycosyltransferase n=1 Tax=Neisseria lisongii TaxID=2912188 RepID=A0ABY7RLZ9_9NEIS|nr:glycosyltransferase [Neisseria lisongii]MCF7521457.1 glycosyltransferase [Neisseria lisongii]WCL72292.1 glycosyltransferase [Neisseria lisongii]